MEVAKYVNPPRSTAARNLEEALMSGEQLYIAPRIFPLALSSITLLSTCSLQFFRPHVVSLLLQCLIWRVYRMILFGVQQSMKFGKLR
jgi:hypothetical protein